MFKVLQRIDLRWYGQILMHHWPTTSVTHKPNHIKKKKKPYPIIEMIVFQSNQKINLLISDPGALGDKGPKKQLRIKIIMIQKMLCI